MRPTKPNSVAHAKRGTGPNGALRAPTLACAFAP
jgi:hypothetical protein